MTVHDIQAADRRARFPLVSRKGTPLRLSFLPATLGELDSVRTHRILWNNIPAFRYTEADDWGLAGADLADAVRDLLESHPNIIAKIAVDILDDPSLPITERRELARDLLDILRRRDDIDVKSDLEVPL